MNHHQDCDPKEIALKSFFLGPQAENAQWIGALLGACFDQWVSWRKSTFTQDGRAISEKDLQITEFDRCKKNIESTVFEMLEKFSKEVPKHSPRYLGHMVSEVSIPALIGHIVTLFHNPNNISGDSSAVGINFEKEAIQYLANMVGYGERSCGHFTSGGTIANFEGLIRARARTAEWLALGAAISENKKSFSSDLFQDAHMGWDHYLKNNSLEKVSSWNYIEQDPWSAAKKIESIYKTSFTGAVMLVPGNKHYSWKKGCQLLGLGTSALWSIDLDQHGRMSIRSLKKLIERAATEKKPIAMIVSVAGTTEMGSIDPVHEVQAVIDGWKKGNGIHLWHHVDAAYGGFLCSMNRKDSKILSQESLAALSEIANANSITIDPHKLGYVPYSSGVFIARDKQDYYFRGTTDAPYLDFDYQADKGPFTLEGSRSAAGAVATWMTAKTMGFTPDGYGLLLERTIRIAQELAAKISESGLSIKIAPGADTNLICFSCAKEGELLSLSNARTLKVYEAFSFKKGGPFMVSKTTLNWESYGLFLDEWTKKWSAHQDVSEVILVRMCIMNPFFGSKQMKVNFLDLFINELKKIEEL